jgi:chromosome segregation ATPase
MQEGASMPATGTSASRSRAKAASRPRATEAARKRCEENNRVIDRVAKSLETAQTDLSAIRGSVGAGASDLRKDVTRLLRDARRDLTKMSKAVRRDLERAQKDLTSAAKPVSARTRRGARSSAGSSAGKPRNRRPAK